MADKHHEFGAQNEIPPPIGYVNEDGLFFIVV